MEEADWLEDRTRMMAHFWRNIQVHKYCSMQNPVVQKALLAYQVEQCKRWHVAVKTSSGPYDLSLVNERVLKETRERVYWETRDKRDNARDYKAQAEASSQLVLFALDKTLTGSLSARPLAHGTMPATPFAHALAEFLPCGMENMYAATGNDSVDATKLLMTEDTFAPDVAHPLTELKLVLERRKLKALTPYDPDAWEKELFVEV
ncbi:uncharacterized protein BJ212DRAFT_1486264 [Suillus subaureus]|uniref:Uncharacterized protein n=1 Tax=Suillus subaureus TaxID=48587 RepID=A0A9P7DY01_9AGAM|nr:uncharacterized protein BJ212DRAFT_1486264 [Suillus subaureus]KAG1805706.1 hypothetical protein BJ212DRAFT_1486264 [Suillus subaureus]